MAILDIDNLVSQAKGFNDLKVIKQIGLMVGLAVSVALGVGVVSWAQEPEYKILLNNISDTDAGEVTTVLDQSGIDYRLPNYGGTLMVSASDLYNARILLAKQGLPKTEETGYAILDNSSGFGVSSFMENIKYQRALESELSKTIKSIESVRAARVHLAIPKKSVFLRDKKKATASVTIDLYSGVEMSKQQVYGITYMIASSVSDIAPEDVTVIDQKGRLLTAKDQDTGAGASDSQFEYKKKIENYYSKRIEEILVPILGAASVKAQVSVEIDFSVTEQTQETFNPDLPAVRSEQTYEESSLRRGLTGVPGSLSNQVPEVAVGDKVESGFVPDNSMRRVVRNYELDKTISHTKFGSGKLKRLTAAVVVNYITEIDDEGVKRYVPLSAEAIDRITTLVKDAVGYRVERGDSINVINSEFLMDEIPVEDVEVSLLDNPLVITLSKQLGALIVVLVLILGVLKPILKSLVTVRKVSEGRSDEQPGEPLIDETGAVIERKGSELVIEQNDEEYDLHLDAARQLTMQDPKKVAQVLKVWVNKDA